MSVLSLHFFSCRLQLSFLVNPLLQCVQKFCFLLRAIVGVFPEVSGISSTLTLTTFLICFFLGGGGSSGSELSESDESNSEKMKYF